MAPKMAAESTLCMTPLPPPPFTTVSIPTSSIQFYRLYTGTGLGVSAEGRKSGKRKILGGFGRKRSCLGSWLSSWEKTFTLKTLMNFKISIFRFKTLFQKKVRVDAGGRRWPKINVPKLALKMKMNFKFQKEIAKPPKRIPTKIPSTHTNHL